jgi:hypothetical protein
VSSSLLRSARCLGTITGGGLASYAFHLSPSYGVKVKGACATVPTIVPIPGSVKAASQR